MRGNIGIEIDAVYDAVKPDFMMIAPGYPKNNRTILEGIHYLNGVPLAETEIALDPKTPVTISYLPDLLKQQTNYSVGEITVTDLEAGSQRGSCQTGAVETKKRPVCAGGLHRGTAFGTDIADDEEHAVHFCLGRFCRYCQLPSGSLRTGIQIRRTNNPAEFRTDPDRGGRRK